MRWHLIYFLYDMVSESLIVNRLSIVELLIRTRLTSVGETEWSKVGKKKGTTEKGLTEHGREEARAVADGFVGDGRLIDPASLVHVLVSPRHRARETFELMMSNIAEASYSLTVCEDVREWEHGLYEGMTTQEIRALRAGQGLDEQKEWSIWTGGCEGGEYATFFPFFFFGSLLSVSL